MGRLGMGELVVILIIVLIIFGAGKLPQIGESLGKAIHGFKKASAGEDEKPAVPPQQAQKPDAQPPADTTQKKT